MFEMLFTPDNFFVALYGIYDVFFDGCMKSVESYVHPDDITYQAGNHQSKIDNCNDAFTKYYTYGQHPWN